MYRKLNDGNKKSMENEIDDSLKFEWDDKKLIDIIIPKFEPIYRSVRHPDKITGEEYRKINIILSNYNDKKIDEIHFKKQLKSELDKINKKYSGLDKCYEFDYNYYNEIFSQSYRLLILGDGGIGKSHYLFELEKKLENQKIAHLCIYCKYTKYIDTRIIEFISNIKENFYFIIDAFNELTENEKKEMLKNIKSVTTNNNVHLIVSYRKNTMSKKYEEDLKELINNVYEFKGVSFESALNTIIEIRGIDTSKFQDLLLTNNPLYLKVLYEVLLDKRIRKNTINSVVQLTFILEAYIKKKTNLTIWNHVKKIAHYMYDNDETSIAEKNLKTLLNEQYVCVRNALIENNIIDFYIIEKDTYYFFKLELLSDFLITRSFFNDLDNKPTEEILNIIKKKINAHYSWKESIILILFSKYIYKTDYLFEILEKSNLIEDITPELLRKITFPKKSIGNVQNKLKSYCTIKWFYELGGFYDRPFNCINFFNKLFLDNSSLLIKFDYQHFYYEKNIIKSKIKNCLYNILLKREVDEYVTEMFWFSVWCCCSTNFDLRKMSLKLLYEIVNKFNNFKNILKVIYFKISDDYIKDAIVEVLVNISLVNYDDLKCFFKKILLDSSEISCRRVYLAYKYLYTDYNYVLLNKRNIYLEIPKNYKPEPIISKLIFKADLYEKGIFHFNRYNDEYEIALFEKFMIKDRKEISDWNKLVVEQFSCMIDEESFCSQRNMFDEVKEHISFDKGITISLKDYYKIFQYIFYEISNKYDFDYNKEENFDERFNLFENSLLRKCLLVTQDLFFGTLMVNYYLEDFECLNSTKDFIGMSPFIPSTYYLYDINLCVPISLFNERVEKLNNRIIMECGIVCEKNEKWLKNKSHSLNVLNNLLSSSFSINNTDWYLISGDLKYYFHKDSCTTIECYSITIDFDYNHTLVANTHETDRLVLDRDEFTKNVFDYNHQNFYRTVELPFVDYSSGLFKDLKILFPPNIIIKEFELHYDQCRSCWTNSKGEVVIMCGGIATKYQGYEFNKSLYIKKEYLEKIKNKYDYKYFIYLNKYISGINDAVHSTFDLEYSKDFKIIKELDHHRECEYVEKEWPKMCENCKHDFINKEKEKLKENPYVLLLEELGYKSDKL